MNTSKKDTNPLGEKLARSIDQLGISHIEFARRMGLSGASDAQKVSNWMRRGLPCEHSFQAGRVLGKNPEWLVTTDPSVPEYPAEIQAYDERTRQALIAMLGLPEPMRQHLESFLKQLHESSR